MSRGLPRGGTPAGRARLSIGALVVVVVALAGWAVLQGGGERSGGRGPRAEVAAPGGAPVQALRAAEALPAAGDPGADGGGSFDPSARAAVRGGAVPAARRRSPVRGRLVVAETLDPIGAAFSVRLRTADLRLAESLVTAPDGTFTSTTAFPRSVVLALVEDGDGRELVDHEAAFDPASEEEWLVRVPRRAYPTVARGRLVDAGGAGVPEAWVQLVPPGDGWATVREAAGEDGSFELAVARPGTFRLLAQGRFGRSEPAEVVLHAGPNDLGLLVVDAAGAGDVRVRIRSEGPGWPDAWLVLRDGAGHELLESAAAAEEAEDGVRELTIPRVPPGAYTLEARPRDGRVFRPARVELRPPAVVELAAGPAGEPFLLKAHDAVTGESLPAFQVVFRANGVWERAALWATRHRGFPAAEERSNALVLPPATEQWILWAHDHRPARGRREPAAGGTHDAALVEGFGDVLFFHDIETALGGGQSALLSGGLPGAEVVSGGELLGTSDADGLFVLDLEEPPEALEFGLPGWRVASSERATVWRIGLAAPR